MKILLVDNHSKHRQELIDLLENHATVKIQEQLGESSWDSYDLVVLSGGSNVPSVFYNPEAYLREISLVQDMKVPILGVCLGSEIITKAFGGTLQDFGSVHRGEVKIIITDESLRESIGQNTLQVYEAHEVGVKDLPKDFLVCAYSEHGSEIIKHKTKSIIGIQFHPEVMPRKELVDWVMKKLK